MNTNDKRVEEYSIPFRRQSGCKWTFHLLNIILIIMFLCFALIPLEKDIEVVVLKIISSAAGILFLCMWIFIGVLKKQYLELTEEYIRIRTLFGEKTIEWKQIHDVQVFTQNHNTLLGIVLKDKFIKRKETFWNLISDMYGGMFSVRIAFSDFHGIDIEKLYSIIIDKLIKVNENATNDISENVDSYCVKSDEDTKTAIFPLTLVKLTLLSIAIGLGYGFSIYILKSNIILIPILGSIAILYYYSKLYKEEKINIIIRTLVGLICSIQVFIGVIVTIILESKWPITIDNIIYLTNQYFVYLMKDPLDQGIIIVAAMLCFLYGSVQGYKFRFQKKIEKIFMKKIGSYYYKREGRLVSIYLKDPVLFNEDQEEMFIGHLYKDCLIEKEKKRVKALYIPAKGIEELGIVINYDDRIEINNIIYYKIGLNSNGNYQPYIFHCSLITNNKKEVELIQIEL